MTYAPETKGWLKYASSDQWHPVEVLSRVDGSHTYTVRRTRTEFMVGPDDILIVVGG